MNYSRRVTARHDAGFTLLELLVVIAIIGVLATIVLASLSEARSKARDSTRLAMLREMRNAMELYYSDHDTYPTPVDGASPGAGELGPTVANTPGLQTYYSEVPVDPLNPATAYFYETVSGGYAIALVLENQHSGVYCQYRVNAPTTIFDSILGPGTPDCL